MAGEDRRSSRSKSSRNDNRERSPTRSKKTQYQRRKTEKDEQHHKDMAERSRREAMPNSTTTQPPKPLETTPATTQDQTTSITSTVAPAAAQNTDSTPKPTTAAPATENEMDCFASGPTQTESSWGMTPLEGDTLQLTGFTVADGTLQSAPVQPTPLPTEDRENFILTTKPTLCTKWKNDQLLAARISHIVNFDKNQAAKDLQKRGLWDQVNGMSVARSKRVMEVWFDNIVAARELLTTPLNTHGVSLTFVESVSDVVTVSLLSIPLGFPAAALVKTMEQYGTIKDHYPLREKVLNRNLPTGSHIFKFDYLSKPIPELLYFGRRIIRTIYTGQKEHLQEYEKNNPQPQADQPPQVAPSWQTKGDVQTYSQRVQQTFKSNASKAGGNLPIPKPSTFDYRPPARVTFGNVTISTTGVSLLAEPSSQKPDTNIVEKSDAVQNSESATNDGTNQQSSSLDSDKTIVNPDKQEQTTSVESKDATGEPVKADGWTTTGDDDTAVKGLVTSLVHSTSVEVLNHKDSDKRKRSSKDAKLSDAECSPKIPANATLERLLQDLCEERKHDITYIFEVIIKNAEGPDQLLHLLNVVLGYGVVSDKEYMKYAGLMLYHLFKGKPPDHYSDQENKIFDDNIKHAFNELLCETKETINEIYSSADFQYKQYWSIP